MVFDGILTQVRSIGVIVSKSINNVIIICKHMLSKQQNNKNGDFI